MKIEQLIKKVNNTELGKTSTHETYIQVPNDWNVTSIFSEIEKNIVFVDKVNKKGYPARLTVGREQRICGLGQYYRDKGLNAGDEVSFEKIVLPDEEKFFISSRKLTNTIVLRKDSKGYEVLTPERLPLISDSVVEKRTNLPLRIVFQHAEKKRNDSQEETNYYDVLLGESSLDISFSNKDMIEIEVSNNVATIGKDFIWKKATFNWEV